MAPTWSVSITTTNATRGSALTTKPSITTSGMLLARPPMVPATNSFQPRR